jgi:hypothetical protein
MAVNLIKYIRAVLSTDLRAANYCCAYKYFNEFVHDKAQSQLETIFPVDY